MYSPRLLTQSSFIYNIIHKTPLPVTSNMHGNKLWPHLPMASVPIQSLTIPYNCPTNLRNQFSIRNIENRGRAVSSYLT
eukprot:CCRYP_007437-RA/>CCRYP_007437-RA protein AED:0.70 eAED:0.89 QI:0/-1/0/1/-1/0/1/0/78